VQLMRRSAGRPLGFPLSSLDVLVWIPLFNRQSRVTSGLALGTGRRKGDEASSKIALAGAEETRGSTTPCCPAPCPREPARPRTGAAPCDASAPLVA
jgi:hypothetical protein